MVETPKETPTAEEIKQEEAEEEELTTTAEEAKVRTQIIEKHGLDEDADADLIANLVKDKLEDMKRFGKLVGQKRKWRGIAQKEPEKEIKKVQPEGDEKFGKEEVEKLIADRDFKKDLESLDVSDELRKQVETYAKLNNCSPKEALKSSYITFLKSEEDKKAQEVEAGVGGIRRTHAKKGGEEITKENFSADNFDFTTEEGRKEYEETKKRLGMV